ncbi:wall-associated receptor kinase-like 1 isoform X1 [Prunus yedoensis var. nudiflora]|uniref:Wall-associated receptor kinase-like 1 isoform X1 n=1 Tax=Prunus yedoensis var. nudiflora TaxID=2094558 RepID=A0A314XVT4_PRUYE|nr:wall-associated receptor kinase-like 1 isoform X1 [Prunus yedoensis var. nudiflora]
MTILLDQHMIFILLFCLWHISIAQSASRAAAPPIAMPNCTTLCGGVSIPYPFGIGPSTNCFLNEWFQIDCNKSTGHKPFLRRAQLEVLDISINGTLRVNSPVTFLCNTKKGNSSHQLLANLTGSFFVFSQRHNIFTAVSCGFLAVVTSSNDDDMVAVTDKIIGGCRSICDSFQKGRPNYDGCDGINCCQTTIPPNLTSVTTHILYANASSIDCTDYPPTDYIYEKNINYAFLVDREWFDNTSSRAVQAMEKVPVVLEWALQFDNNVTDLLFTNYIHGERNRSRRHDPTPYCEVDETSTYSFSPRHMAASFYCYCPEGFEGNPYLRQSCHDIDECSYNPTICLAGSKCVNDYGGYHCSVNKMRALNWALKGLGAGLGLILLLIGLWLGYRLIKKRNDIKNKKKFFKRNGGLLLEQQLSSGEVNVERIKLFKSTELEKSTDNFNVNRILGQGGQGTVYKGMLTDGRIVAVKKSKVVDEGQLSEFINEVVILSQINHRNVVKILGCCLETEVPLLVYEFIPNGTLYQYIQGQIEEFQLTWQMRLRIASEISGALSYLHSAASFPIYHRDIKSTNILLDEKYRAKVADFGTSRSIVIGQTHLTTVIHGTFGYLDPEYFRSSQFTEKSDVYSFGVVLVELLTGEKHISLVTSSAKEKEYRSLAAYFITSMEEDRLLDIVDALVLKEGSEIEIRVVANLARRCLNLNGRNRPTMREVTAELEALQMAEKSSNAQQNYEGVEFVEHKSIEQWGAVSSSTRTGWSAWDRDGDDPTSSLLELPQLSVKTW